MPFAGKALYSDRKFPKYKKFASKRVSMIFTSQRASEKTK